MISSGGSGWKCWEPQPPGDLTACPGLYRNILKFLYSTPDFQTDPINMQATKYDID